jgi:hypothetical protein
VKRKPQPPCSFIIFKEGISLPSLPPGFVINSEYEHGERLSIKKVYDINNADECKRAIFESMQALTKWAENLLEL